MKQAARILAEPIARHGFTLMPVATSDVRSGLWTDPPPVLAIVAKLRTGASHRPQSAIALGMKLWIRRGLARGLPGPSPWQRAARPASRPRARRQGGRTTAVRRTWTARRRPR